MLFNYPFSRIAVTEIVKLCIRTAVADEKAHEFVQQFLLFLLLHIKGEPATSKGLEEIEAACDIISADSLIILDATAVNACQSVSTLIDPRTARLISGTVHMGYSR